MDDQALYQEIAENALAVTGARMVAVVRLNPERQTTQLLGIAGLKMELVQRAFVVAGQLIPGADPFKMEYPAYGNPVMDAVYRDGRPVLAPYAEAATHVLDPRLVGLATRIVGIRYSYICPFMHQGRAVGNASFHTADFLNEREQRVCQAFSRQAALTLENAELLTGERRQRRALDALHSAALQLASPVPLEAAAVRALLATIVRQSVAAVAGRDGALTLTDDPFWADLLQDQRGARPMIFRAQTDDCAHQAQDRAGPDTRAGPEATTARVLATGQPVLVRDTREHASFAALVRGGVLSYAEAPLLASGRALGTLAVHFAAPGEADNASGETLQLIAAHAAAALERVCLTVAVRAQARLDGALLSARTAAHSLNNALAPITGYAELLGLDPVVHRNPSLAKYITAILDAGEQAAEQVRRLQRVIRLEETASPLGPHLPVLDLERSAGLPPTHDPRG